MLFSPILDRISVSMMINNDQGGDGPSVKRGMKRTGSVREISIGICRLIIDVLGFFQPDRCEKLFGRRLKTSKFPVCVLCVRVEIDRKDRSLLVSVSPPVECQLFIRFEQIKFFIPVRFISEHLTVFFSLYKCSMFVLKRCKCRVEIDDAAEGVAQSTQDLVFCKSMAKFRSCLVLCIMFAALHLDERTQSTD